MPDVGGNLLLYRHSAGISKRAVQSGLAAFRPYQAPARSAGTLPVSRVFRRFRMPARPMPHDRAPPAVAPPPGDRAHDARGACAPRSASPASSGCACSACSSCCRCFALYAETLPGGRDHTLVGLALGAYGLTQARAAGSVRLGVGPLGQQAGDRHRARHLRRSAASSRRGRRPSAGRSPGARAGRGRDLRGGASRSPPISRATRCARARWP